MLYTIGDLHLSFSSNKPMDAFGGAWIGYIQKLIDGFSALQDDDMCVLCGDLTWAMDLESALEDFRFIDKFPGRKIILKGNHDYWWSTATKAKRFFAENGITTIDILHNNCFFYEDIAICGTRGWFYTENTGSKHDAKVMAREINRLETSLKAAGNCKRKMCFLHYPPMFYNYVCREMITLMQDYGVSDCWYGHIHGAGHAYAIQGVRDDIHYHMISSDYIGFHPWRIE